MRENRSTDLINKIYKHSLVALFAAAGLSAFVDWSLLPFSVVTGGALGLINIRALAWSVQGMIGTDKGAAKLMFFSQFRLVMLFVALAVLAYLRIVNLIGVLIGLTVVFSAVIVDGLRHHRKKE
ncbi:MAG: hypothetical protein OHK006_24690 [Thermodesulfovibrionales bacterium]